MVGFVNEDELNKEHAANLKHFIENVKSFIEQDERLKLDKKYFSAAGNNFAIEHNSSPRGIMGASQISNILSLCDTDINTIQSGTDYELGKYTLIKKIEKASEILAVIKRHNSYGSNVVAERLVIYREMETGIINCVEIPRYSKLHTYFGYENHLSDDVDNFVRGDVVPNDTILAKPDSLKDDGGYGYGRNVNVALMPLSQNDEDGFIISDDLPEAFKFKLYETRTMEVDEDEFLINLSGNPDVYKPFKDLGERIGDDGVVFAKRKYDYKYGPALLSKIDMCDYNPIFDNVVYDRSGGGLVVDIKVFRNQKRKKKLPTQVNDLLDKYHDSTLSYYKQIINIYETLNKENRTISGSELTVGESFNTLLVEAYGIVESSRDKSKLKKMYKLSNLSLYRIEVVIEHTIIPDYRGVKASDLSANRRNW